jgi:hypothetical protein
MKQVLILIICWFPFLSSLSQERLDGLSLFHLGDTINKYREYIDCAEMDTSLSGPNEKEQHACQAFRYLPAKNDTIQISAVRFPEVFFHTNKEGRIKEVMFQKIYWKNDPSNKKKRIVHETDLMRAFMTSFAVHAPLSIKDDKLEQKDYDQEQFTWQKDGVKYSLFFTEFKNKLKGKLLYSITFSIAEINAS